MKKHHLAALVVIGAAAAGLAAAPAATAASPAAGDAPHGVVITERPGHIHIDATPDPVSPPRVYGPFSSPAPFMWN